VCRAVILILVLSLPGAASANMPSLYSPFDQTHNGHNGNPSPSISNTGSGDAVMGCGRGRYRDQITQRCRGPADFH
jgi:hypothetical protein